MERVTRLERATNSLEGCDSSQLSYTRTTGNMIVICSVFAILICIIFIVCYILIAMYIIKQ